MPRRPAHETFEQFLEYLEPYVNRPGVVRTAVVLVRLEYKYSKSYITANLKKAMDLMVEQGRAKKIENGRWEVLKISKVA